MGYRKPGYSIQPEGWTLPYFCNTIITTGPTTWSRDLISSLSGMASDRRRVSDLSQESVWAIKGEGAFANTPNSSAYIAFASVLMRFLNHLGVVEAAPVVVRYDDTPQMNIEDVISKMLTPYMRFPSWEELGGEQAFTMEALKDVFPVIVRKLDYYGKMRGMMLDHLRLKMADIAFKIAHSMPITQHERSFFCLYSVAGPGSPLGCTADEVLAGKTVPYAVGKATSPRTEEFWSQYCAAVEPGPMLRFARMVSNTLPEQLVMLFGPQVGSLSYELGYERRHGPFTEPVVSEVIALPWTEEDQLMAAREQALAIQMPNTEGFLTYAPAQLAMGKGTAYENEWDDPSVMIRIDVDQGALARVEYSRVSKWRQRVISSENGLTPNGMLIDMAVTEAKLGGAEVAELTMTKWPLIDMATSKAFLGGRGSTQADLKERILIPSQGAKTLADPKSIDMRPFYERMGIANFPPAFKDYVMVPMRWLFEPDAPAEEYISTVLNLTREQQIQAQPCIRISHNFAKLSRLLAESQLPLTFDEMKRVAGAVVGYV